MSDKENNSYEEKDGLDKALDITDEAIGIKNNLDRISGLANKRKNGDSAKNDDQTADGKGDTATADGKGDTATADGNGDTATADGKGDTATTGGKGDTVNSSDKGRTVNSNKTAKLNESNKGAETSNNGKTVDLSNTNPKINPENADNLKNLENIKDAAETAENVANVADGAAKAGEAAAGAASGPVGWGWLVVSIILNVLRWIKSHPYEALALLVVVLVLAALPIILPVVVIYALIQALWGFILSILDFGEAASYQFLETISGGVFDDTWRDVSEYMSLLDENSGVEGADSDNGLQTRDLMLDMYDMTKNYLEELYVVGRTIDGITLPINLQDVIPIKESDKITRFEENDTFKWIDLDQTKKSEYLATTVYGLSEQILEKFYYGELYEKDSTTSATSLQDGVSYYGINVYKHEDSIPSSINEHLNSGTLYNYSDKALDGKVVDKLKKGVQYYYVSENVEYTHHGDTIHRDSLVSYYDILGDCYVDGVARNYLLESYADLKLKKGKTGDFNELTVDDRHGKYGEIRSFLETRLRSYVASENDFWTANGDEEITGAQVTGTLLGELFNQSMSVISNANINSIFGRAFGYSGIGELFDDLVLDNNHIKLDGDRIIETTVSTTKFTYRSEDGGQTWEFYPLAGGSYMDTFCDMKLEKDVKSVVEKIPIINGWLKDDKDDKNDKIILREELFSFDFGNDPENTGDISINMVGFNMEDYSIEAISDRILTGNYSINEDVSNGDLAIGYEYKLESNVKSEGKAINERELVKPYGIPSAFGYFVPLEESTRNIPFLIALSQEMRDTSIILSPFKNDSGVMVNETWHYTITESTNSSNPVGSSDGFDFDTGSIYVSAFGKTLIDMYPEKLKTYELRLERAPIREVISADLWDRTIVNEFFYTISEEGDLNNGPTYTRNVGYVLANQYVEYKMTPHDLIKKYNVSQVDVGIYEEVTGRPFLSQYVYDKIMAEDTLKDEWIGAIEASDLAKPVEFYNKMESAGNYGIKYSLGSEQNVYPVKDGEVIKVLNNSVYDKNALYSRYVIVYHKEDKTFSMYATLDTINTNNGVYEGAEVYAGETVLGTCQGSMYFEYRQGGGEFKDFWAATPISVNDVMPKNEFTPGGSYGNNGLTNSNTKDEVQTKVF